MNTIALLSLILILLIIVLIVIAAPYIHQFTKKTFFNQSSTAKIGSSSKIRLIHQVKEAVSVLSKNKTGAIITIQNTNNLDELRTDGVIIDANISSSLIISIFQKESPLHDGAIVIVGDKIKYAATYYKISEKSIDNRYGARHRAAMGISEQSDATTIVVSEETGDVSITKSSTLNPAPLDNFQEILVKNIN